MTRKPISLLINALLFLSLLVSITACSSPSTDAPVQETAIPAPTEPIELPTLASTPTNSFAFLPTETTEAIAEITPTPSFDWCKSVDTRAASSDDVKMDPPPEDEAFGAYACLLEIVGVNINDYTTQAIDVKIGFVDSAGIVHPYRAVIGGLIYKNSTVEDFKYPKCASQNPEYFTLDEYTAFLQTFINPAEPKEFPLLVLSRASLKYHWPPEASLINNFADTHLILKNAVETDSDFPEAPESYQLFILPGLEVCK
ncbi:MAG: hypothetical protein JW908_02925 [Anaerolineales bacterium]|nr:hypothetical protein [Anaerolineales bacterium]